MGNEKGHGVEIPQWKNHFGAGRLIDESNFEHKTSQFGLFKLMYERALIDPRRTENPLEATSFLIPYDFGMDATFLEKNGRMRRTSCPLAPEVSKLLSNSNFFTKNMGHNHILINSVNQNMNYFMGAQNCVDILRLCWNCTKLSIDEYLFTAQDRNFEMKNRGINWHAVPFPSDYHFSSKLNPSTGSLVPPPWTNHQGRRVLVSFTGSPRRYNSDATAIRESLLVQCEKYSLYNLSHPPPQSLVDRVNSSPLAPNPSLEQPLSTKKLKGKIRGMEICSHGSYNHEATAKSSGPNRLSRESVFCLQPPGDMPTRKSLFDSVLSGCIPVLFHPLTATFMYEWHLGQQAWEDVSVTFDSVQDFKDIVSQKLDVIERLVSLFVDQPDIVRRKKERITELAFQLQYSLIEERSSQEIQSLLPLLDTQSFPSQPNRTDLHRRLSLPHHSHHSPHHRLNHLRVQLIQDSMNSLRLGQNESEFGKEQSDDSFPSDVRSWFGTLSHALLSSRPIRFVTPFYRGQRDAYEVSMNRVLQIHAGLSSHNRTSHFIACIQLEGKGPKGQKLQTADRCNRTNTLTDPYSPPSVIDHFKRSEEV